MAEKKVIAVVGATGAQGGGLVRAILSDAGSGFTARALTRNVNSDKATELAKLDADVVAADLDEIASLKRAFEGAYGAFCVTNFWEHFSPGEKASPSDEPGPRGEGGWPRARHLVHVRGYAPWVPLGDNRMPTLMGKYKVPHFDAKGEANHVFTEMGVPTTCLLTSFYWDNFIYFGMGPKRGPGGKLAITLPMGDKKLPGIAAEDIGKCCYGIFQRGKELIGKTVGVAGEHLTGMEMAAAFTRALGEEVRCNDVTPQVYRNLGFPGADDLDNMFQFKRDFNESYCDARNVEVARGLNPTLQTFDEWLDRNKSRIPLE